MCDFAGEIKNPATSLGPFGTAMSAIGNLVAAGASTRAGRAKQAESNYVADQLQQNASNVVAAGQRTAENENLKAKILASRALAVAAASGGDATSPGVSHIVADIAGRGAYNAGVALYDAEDKARQMLMGAESSRYSGQVARAGGQSKAAAYLFGSAGNLAQASSLFSKYGRGGPKTSTNPMDTAYNADPTATGDW